MQRFSPRVSVVIPALNAEDTVAAAVLSVKAQSYDSSLIEIIVVDNCSSDATAAAAEASGARVVRASPKNRARARNEGVRAAAGDLLFFLDADCTASPNWIECLVRLVQSEGVDAAQGTVTPRGGLPISYEHFSHDHLGIPFIDTKGCVVTKDAAARFGGFDESLSRCEDIDLAWKIISGGGRVGFSDQCGVTSGVPKGFVFTVIRAYETARGLRQVHRAWRTQFGLTIVRILGGFALIGRREVSRRGPRSGLPARVRFLYACDSLLTGVFYLLRVVCGR